MFDACSYGQADAGCSPQPECVMMQDDHRLRFPYLCAACGSGLVDAPCAQKYLAKYKNIRGDDLYLKLLSSFADMGKSIDEDKMARVCYDCVDKCHTVTASNQAPTKTASATPAAAVATTPRESRCSIPQIVACQHTENTAMSIPCNSDNHCQLWRPHPRDTAILTQEEVTFAGCDNQMRSDLVEVLPCHRLGEGDVRYRRGLFCKAACEIPAGTFVASFGPVRSSDQRMQQHLGYSVQISREKSKRGTRGRGRETWSKVVEFVTPEKGWQQRGFQGPFVNHTCCVNCVNSELCVSGNTGPGEESTLNVKTFKALRCRAEVLVHYGADFAAVLGQQCMCCACLGEAGCRRACNTACRGKG